LRGGRKKAIYQTEEEELEVAEVLRREMVFATLLLAGIQVMFRGRESVWRG